MFDILVLYSKNTYILEESRFWDLLQSLPSSLQDVNNQYSNRQDRELHLLGKLLLMEGLHRCGFNPKLIHNLEYSPNQKPVIPGTISFNIAHSGNYAVCAFNRNGNIGIDIEKFRRIDLLCFKRVMNENEWQQIQNSKDAYRTFFHLWTIKESVIKAGDLGLDQMDQVHTNGKTAWYTSKVWDIQALNIHENYVCNVACDKEIGNIHIESVELKDFLKNGLG